MSIIQEIQWRLFKVLFFAQYFSQVNQGPHTFMAKYVENDKK